MNGVAIKFTGVALSVLLGVGITVPTFTGQESMVAVEGKVESYVAKTRGVIEQYDLLKSSNQDLAEENERLQTLVKDLEESNQLLQEETKALRWRIETLEQQLESGDMEVVNQEVEEHCEAINQMLDETIFEGILEN